MQKGKYYRMKELVWERASWLPCFFFSQLLGK